MPTVVHEISITHFCQYCYMPVDEYGHRVDMPVQEALVYSLRAESMKMKKIIGQCCEDVA